MEAHLLVLATGARSHALARAASGYPTSGALSQFILKTFISPKCYSSISQTQTQLGSLPYPPHEYKRLVVEAFDASSQQPNASSDPLSERLAQGTLVHAQLLRGQSVLDIATGTGSLLTSAAQAVGTPGRVLGLDISPGMVDQARRNIRAARLHNAEAVLGDAETVAFPRSSYDVVLCSAALPYMHDPCRALARWRTWLRPGGRLVVNCFKGPFDPECGLFYQLAASHGLSDIFADPLAGFGSREAFAELLERAGYQRVQVKEESIDVAAPASSARSYAEAMWDSSCSSPHHNLARLLDKTPEPESAGDSAAGRQGAGDRDGVLDSSGRDDSGGGDANSRSRLAFEGRGVDWLTAGGHRRGSASPAVAAAALRGPRPQAGPTGEPPALGPRRSRSQSSGIGNTNTPTPSGSPQHAQVPVAACRKTDPAALEAFREEFLAAAEGSVARRFRGGVVRTSIGTMYGVGHLS